VASEIVESVIVVAALLTIIVGATAGVWTHIQNQNRAAEVRYAVTVMSQVGDSIRDIVYGGRGEGEVVFDFKYGALQIVEEGGVFASLSISENRITLANIPYQYFKYKVPFQVYGSERVYDVGTEVKPFVQSVASTNVVYHYSEKGDSYVIGKPQVYIASDLVGNKASAYVYIVKFLDMAGASTNGVKFTYERSTPTTTIFPVGEEADAALNIRVGGLSEVKEGSFTIQALQPGQVLEVTVNLIEVGVKWGR